MIIINTKVREKINWSVRPIDLGSVHEVCHAPRAKGRGSEKVWQFVTGEGVNTMWRHTVSFLTIHNLMFYWIFYHTYNKFELPIAPSEWWEIKLVLQCHSSVTCWPLDIVYYSNGVIFHLQFSNFFLNLKEYETTRYPIGINIWDVWIRTFEVNPSLKPHDFKSHLQENNLESEGLRLSRP